mgnify:CR=1 FL=1
MVFTDYPIIRGESGLPLYLINMGLHSCQDHIKRPDGYPHPQILYWTKGTGTLVLDGKATALPVSHAMFLPAGYPHEYLPDGDVWDVHWVVPGGASCGDILRSFGLNGPQVFPVTDAHTLEHMFRKMHDALRSDSIFGNYRAAGFLYDFLIEFYRIISAGSTSQYYSPALMRALDHINSGFAQPITLEQLCNSAGVSRQHLCLLFRRALNMRPMEYTAKRRIQAAKSLLTTTDDTIEQIAEECGFGSESYFCRQFRRYEGITPTAFRNAN